MNFRETLWDVRDGTHMRLSVYDCDDPSLGYVSLRTHNEVGFTLQSAVRNALAADAAGAKAVRGAIPEKLSGSLMHQRHVTPLYRSHRNTWVTCRKILLPVTFGNDIRDHTFGHMRDTIA